MLQPASSNNDLDELEEEDEGIRSQQARQEPEAQSKTRNIVLCALGVALLIFLAAKGSTVLHHQHEEPAAIRPPPQSFRTAHVGAPMPPAPRPRTPPRRKTRTPKLTEKQKEAQRLNDVKTQEIREAQEDPTSMFDMSNARR